MRATQFIIATLREAPADAVAVSHNLMLRAGLIRKLGAGLYHLLPAGLRSFRKVEQVIREEMNAAGALEMQLPILTPAELWERSQRWESMGRAMFRVQDRHDVWNVLGPTHEESFSELVAGLIHSYRDLPLNVYQIHTKFRDEIRPRYGVIRSREFCMKDAYSFHTDDASLEDTYQKMRVAYRRIFARLGLETVPVEADSGPMGGSGSEEFMVASEIGEDTLLLSEGGLYRSNQEKTPVLYAELDGDAASGSQPNTDQNAKTKSKNKNKTKTIAESKSKSELKVQSKAGADTTQKTGPAMTATTDLKELEAVHTPGCRTIEDVAKFLKVDVRGILKTVVYMADGKPIGICLRGDR
ncbi:MAG: proline--tRNA ligase, partial [Leptospiraceae bacterium]|nr:proline--tRNA ligase [Leptospiraceae bacterium]